MKWKLLEILACPKCLGGLSCSPAELGEDGDIKTGSLECGIVTFHFLAPLSFPIMNLPAASFEEFNP